MTQAIRRVVTETGTARELACRVAARKGWVGSEHDWLVRLDQMLSDGMPLRVCPADCIPDVIEVTGDASILAPAHAAMIRVQAEAGAPPQRPPLARVLPGKRKEARRA